jgi:hypothetical protein
MGSIPTAAGRFHLELDGQPCGFLRSVEGGTVKAEVVTEPPGSEHYLKKHLANVATEPIALSFDLSLAPSVYDWIADAWTGRQSPHSGRIVFSDATLKATKELEFQHALIESVTFPALDGASRDPGYLTAVIRPETARFQKASGDTKGAVASKSKQWLASNFRVDIDSLDGKHVSKVDAFRVDTAVGAEVGPHRDASVAPHVDFPSLRVTVAETGAAAWQAWHQDFVVNGNCSDAEEKAGALVLLDPTMKEFGRVELGGLGIYRLAPEKAEAGKEAVARLVAELYCERMELAL